MVQQANSDVLQLLREARQRSRGYASFFGWVIDRDLEELGPVKELANALSLRDGEQLHSIQIRGRGKDPPDLEALNNVGQRVAIEVTELVDEAAIQECIAGDKTRDNYVYAEWTKETFKAKLQSLVSAKAARLPKLLDGPYPGGYVIVVFTDEPMLTPELVGSYLARETFMGLSLDCRAYLLLSYWPDTKSYPYFTLRENA